MKTQKSKKLCNIPHIPYEIHFHVSRASQECGNCIGPALKCSFLATSLPLTWEYLKAKSSPLAHLVWREIEGGVSRQTSLHNPQSITAHVAVSRPWGVSIKQHRGVVNKHSLRAIEEDHRSDSM